MGRKTLYELIPLPIPMSALLINPNVKKILDIPPPPSNPLNFHRKLPDYSPTPLHEAYKIANELGVGKVLVKNESNRFGLPAFKVLGASWGIYCLLKLRFGVKDEDWNSVEGLYECLKINKLLWLVTATDGNHGRGVARVARWFGFGSHIFVPRNTITARIEAIRSEGAEVIVVEGDYDRAVEEAADHAGSVSWLIQDTGWPGNERIPGWIVDGYSTICWEIENQLNEMKEKEPDIIFVQIGVGSLAASVVQFFRNRSRERTPIIIGVEPEGAACAFESVKTGKRITIFEKEPTIMAGLNCGTISSIAWPYIRDGIDVLVKVGDDRAREAVRVLRESGIVSGESGAAGLAGLLEMRHQRKLRELLEARDLKEGDATILLISTEGITDPDLFHDIIDGKREITGQCERGNSE